MRKVEVRVAYDGEALKSGSMDVRELAPALLSIGSMLEEANRILNGDRATINVRVRSDFRTGSFRVFLELGQSLADQIAFLLDGEKVWSASDIAKQVGLSLGTTTSLIGLLKWLRGRPIRSTTVLENGNVRIETDSDFDAIEVSEGTMRLYRDPRVRQAMRGALKPLETKEIDAFEALDELNQPIHTIAKDELHFFTLPKEDAKVIENSTTLWVYVLGVFFEENRKWHLFDGQRRLTASILDQRFLRDIEERVISFKKGDRLLVELLSRQISTSTGMKVEHEVTKVIDHWDAGTQGQLPIN